jgi:anti-sigma regulatory factor (Ser/Thr protein kinase)
MKPVIEQTISINADIENLSKVREFIKKHGGRAGISDDILFDLALVVDEACTNIIDHGYEGVLSGKITVIINIFTDQVEITILDDGRAFDPDEAPEPDINAPWQERRIGGLGWHLIKEMTDDAAYHSDPQKGNRLVLIKMIN